MIPEGELRLISLCTTPTTHDCPYYTVPSYCMMIHVQAVFETEKFISYVEMEDCLNFASFHQSSVPRRCLNSKQTIVTIAIDYSLAFTINKICYRGGNHSNRVDIIWCICRLNFMKDCCKVTRMVTSCLVFTETYIQIVTQWKNFLS